MKLLRLYPYGAVRACRHQSRLHRDHVLCRLQDESLSDSDNLPAPEVIAAEIVEDLEAAL